MPPHMLPGMLLLRHVKFMPPPPFQHVALLRWHPLACETNHDLLHLKQPTQAITWLFFLYFLSMTSLGNTNIISATMFTFVSLFPCEKLTRFANYATWAATIQLCSFTAKDVPITWPLRLQTFPIKTEPNGRNQCLFVQCILVLYWSQSLTFVPGIWHMLWCLEQSQESLLQWCPSYL